jgi:hypothetical protein
VSTFAAEKEKVLALARTNTEQWFDDAMDRASGWYKRSTQLWLGLVGLALAFVLNVDTISVATALWRDHTLRQNAVEQAKKYQLTSTDGSSFSNPAEAAQAIRHLNTQLSQDLHLPIGWRTEVYQLQAGQTCVLLPTRRGDIWGISNQNGCMYLREAAANQNAGAPMKVLGLLLTAVAVTQGAPFWFDLISKLTNPRGSGAVPATSQEQRKETLERKSQGEVVRARS